MEELFYIMYSNSMQILWIIIAIVVLLQIITLQKMRKQKKIFKDEILSLQTQAKNMAEEQQSLKKEIEKEQGTFSAQSQLNTTEKETPDKLIDAVLSEVFS